MDIQYFQMQWKRVWHYIPYVLGYLMLMAALFCVLFMAGSKMLTQQRLAGKINIGVTLPADDVAAELAVSLVTSMDSVSSMCEFAYYGEAEGRKALQNRDVIALVCIPEHLVENIMNGNNTPIKIVTLYNGGIESEMFQEFANAGVSMLGYAQLGIYTVWDYCQYHDDLQVMNTSINQALNQLYMRYALGRVNLFTEEGISATGELTIPEYYICGGSIFLLMLMGIPMAFYFVGENQAFANQLRTRGFGSIRQVVVKYMAAATGLFTIWIGLYGIYWIVCKSREMPVSIAFSQWLVMFLPLCSILSYIQFVYAIVRERIGGILLIFFLSIGMLFCSGAFIPSAFLPEICLDLAKFLPTTYWIAFMGDVLTKQLQGIHLGICVGILLLCVGCSSLLTRCARQII